MTADPYRTLGVSRSATPEEIKKAYRRLAKRHHPDTSADPGAEARFKALTDAYQALSDPAKRAAHDRSQQAAARPRDTGAGVSDSPFDAARPRGFSDVFEDLFGASAAPPHRARGRDVEVETNLTFEQAQQGAQVTVSVSIHETCSVCRGTGARGAAPARVCPGCQGRGRDSTKVTCPRCQGRGTVVDDPCGVCLGAGACAARKRLRVKVPAGVRDGSRVRLAGRGDAAPFGGEPGDLYVTCRVSDSAIFKRVADHVECDVPLTVAEALAGATVEVPTLEGRKRLRVASGTRHGTIARLRGEGPRLDSGVRGDIHYRFVIAMPADPLTAEQQQAVDDLAAAFDQGDVRAGLFA